MFEFKTAGINRRDSAGDLRQLVVSITTFTAIQVKASTQTFLSTTQKAN